MTKYTAKILTTIMIGAALFASSCSMTADEPTAQTKQAAQSYELSFKQGQVLSIVAPIADKAGTEARKEYYAGVFPIAESVGFERNIQFEITETVVGEFEPAALVFFSFPDEAAENYLYNHQDWQGLKALRPKAWKELRIYSNILEDDLSLTFNTDKYYTVAAAWINPERPDDYARYLSGIETAVNELGGRFMYKMNVQRFENHASDLAVPVQLTFVEWDSKAALGKLSSTDAFKANAKYFSSGLKGFELHRISVTPINKS